MDAPDLLSAAQLMVTTFIVLRMVIVGFLQPPGQVLSWPMFTRGCEIIVDLKVRTEHGWEDVDIFRLLPSHHPAITPNDLQVIVDYLTDTWGPVSGTGVVYHAGGQDLLTIEAGRVVS